MRTVAPVIAIAALAGTANAAVSAALTDQATVEAALVGETVETFAIPDVTYPTPSTQAFNGFSVTADGSSTFADFEIAGEALSLFIDDGNIPSFTFDFDSPVNTFAADFGLTNPAAGSGLFFQFNNGDSIELSDATIAGYTGTGFVAFTSDSTFTSLTITANSGLDFFTLDNAVAGIPTPGAAALLALAGIASTRRRR